jgi:hypothetical protein
MLRNGATTNKIYQSGTFERNLHLNSYTINAGDFAIGGRSNDINFASMKAQEFVIYGNDKSTDRTSIESNIGGYFTQNTPLLDTYTGAAACYSLRLMRTAYTGALIRVRRSSDNTELDINANVFGELDTVSLLDFAGTGDAFCKVWYDQSGNSNDATQTATGSQPQIVSSGAVIVENGKPAVEFDGSNDEFALLLSGLNINDLSVSTVCKSDVTTGNRMQFTLNTGSNQRYWHYMNQGNDTMWYGGTTQIIHGAMTTDQRLRTFIAGSTSGAARSFLNGTEASTSNSLVSGTISANEQFLGNYHTGSFYWDGTMQEFIVWGADQYSNRTNIESNINTFYSIY